MNVAIILAGGIGSRVGANVPKQFIEVLGKPVIAYTIEKYQNHPEIDAIEVVCIKEYQEYLEKMVVKYQFDKIKWIVEGGKNFQYSVWNGVRYLEDKLEKEDLLLIHYAASPFVEADIITDAIKVCKEKGNCTSATPIYLLTGSNDDGIKSSQWVDRDRVMGLNVPQSFQFGYVFQLYEEAEAQGLLDKVEPHTTSLMYSLGRTIYFSKGTQANIKITEKEDLELLEGYALLQQKRRNEKNGSKGSGI